MNDAEAPLIKLAAAVLLQAFVDFKSNDPAIAKDAQLFLEQDGGLWFEFAGIPFVDTRIWVISRQLRAKVGYLRDFQNRR
jgi:hypothetical protein